LPYECDGDSSEKKWRAGASGGGFSTTVVFEGDQEVDVQQATISAIVGYQLSTHTGLVASAGAILGGTVDSSSEGDVGKGVTASVTATFLPFFETESRPFILGSVTLGHSRTTAVSDDGMSHDWTATDARLGIMVGKTFAERIVPFVAARGFAGPVFWTLGGEEVGGSDLYHYAVGGGMSYRIPGKLDIFAEAMGLGEKSASLGASLPF
jgi:hypothetical protein